MLFDGTTSVAAAVVKEVNASKILSDGLDHSERMASTQRLAVSEEGHGGKATSVSLVVLLMALLPPPPPLLPLLLLSLLLPRLRPSSLAPMVAQLLLREIRDPKCDFVGNRIGGGGGISGNKDDAVVSSEDRQPSWGEGASNSPSPMRRCCGKQKLLSTRVRPPLSSHKCRNCEYSTVELQVRFYADENKTDGRYFGEARNDAETTGGGAGQVAWGIDPARLNRRLEGSASLDKRYHRSLGARYSSSSKYSV